MCLPLNKTGKGTMTRGLEMEWIVCSLNQRFWRGVRIVGETNYTEIYFMWCLCKIIYWSHTLTVFKLCCIYIEPRARSTDSEALTQTFCIRIFRSRTQESTFLSQFSSLPVNCQFDEYCSKCLPVLFHLFQSINDESSINSSKKHKVYHWK